MRVLGFGTYDVKKHPRVGIMLEGLAGYGHQVHELTHPLAIGTAGRVAALKNPLAALRFIDTVAKSWLELLWESRRYRGENEPDVVIVGYLGHFDVLLARALFPSRIIVLDMLVFAEDTAADRHLDGCAKSALLRFIDHNAMRAADVIVLDTDSEIELVPRLYRSRAVVVPVGASDMWFAARHSAKNYGAAATAVEGKGSTVPSAIFYGLFTPLQGAPIIAEALRILDDRGFRMNVTLVGDGQDASECQTIVSRLHGNVQVVWQEWVQADQLPALVANHDVCLGIFGTSDKARRVVPNKAYQGMAAGCAMITSDTAPQRAMLEGARFVEAGNSEALAAELENLLNSPSDLAEAKALAGKRADQSFGAREVVKPLESLLW